MRAWEAIATARMRPRADVRQYRCQVFENHRQVAEQYLTCLAFVAADLHSVAVKGNEILNAGNRLKGVLVAPGHVVFTRVAHTERPVGGVSLVRSVAGMIGAA